MDILVDGGRRWLKTSFYFWFFCLVHEMIVCSKVFVCKVLMYNTLAFLMRQASNISREYHLTETTSHSIKQMSWDSAHRMQIMGYQKQNASRTR